MDSAAASPKQTDSFIPVPPVVSDRDRVRKPSNLRRMASALLLAAGFVLLRLKAVLILFFEKGRMLFVNPFEGFGVVQFAVAGGSMVLSVGAYAMQRWSLELVIGFVLITAIHEVGHALVIRAKGLRTSWMVFIPFVGGAVMLKTQPRSVWDDAQIGLAGPLAGTFASLASLQLHKWTGDPVYLLIACAGFTLNLFNLVPLGLLDGGRISAAITKWMWVFGGAALTYKTIAQPNPLLILVLILAVFQVYASINREKSDEFYNITRAQRATVAVAYFSLVIFLAHQLFMAFDKIRAIVK